AGTDTIGVLGRSTAADSVTFAAAGISVIGSGTVSDSNVERASFDGRGAWDSLTVSGGPSVQFTGTQHLQSLYLASSTSASVPAGSNRLVVTRGLSVAPGAAIDLNDNDLIVDYSGASQLAAVQSLINTARSGGAWTGSGLSSSSARTVLSH